MILAIAQLNTHAGAFENAARRMVDACRGASEQGAELVLFPLCTLTGPLSPDRSMRAGHQADLFATLDRIAGEVACPCLIPIALDAGGNSYYELCLVREGEVTLLRARSLLQQSERALAALDGDGETILFEHEGMSVGAAFTYEGIEDLIVAEAEVDLVLFMPEYAYALDDVSSAMGASFAENRYGEDAVALGAWLVGASSLGGYGVQTYAGSSFVVSPAGELRACAPSFEEALLFAEVSPAGDAPDASEAPVRLEAEVYNRSLHLWEALVLGLRDYVWKQGREDVALLLDDTLASNLLAALASDALGPMHVHAVPAAGASAECLAHVRDFAAALRISLEPGSGVAVADDDPQVWADLSQAELARVARFLGAVSLSPCDKTYLAIEAAPAACRAAELLPFGDVYRSDLIELAHLRNTISPVFAAKVFRNYGVPQVDGLQELEATPELRLRRIDVTLCNHIEWERTLSECLARQGAREVTSAIIELVRAHQAGREAWPPCLVASSKPLSLLHVPLGYAWRDSVREQAEQGADAGAREVLGLLEGLFGSEAEDGKPSAGAGLSGLMEGLDVELMAGSLPDGVDRSLLEGVLGDLFGLLQDMSQDGSRPSSDGPFGPLTWGSPFSEN